MFTFDPYQVTAIDAVIGHFRAGQKNSLLVSPTGSGKTCMLSGVCARHAAKGGKIVWIAHRRELLEQATRALLAAGCPPESLAVTSCQAITRRRETPKGTLVVLDEAHHYVAKLWRDIPEAYPHSYILGASATPERQDGIGLGEIFSAIHVAAQIKEMIKLWHDTDGRRGLVPCRVVRPDRALGKNQIAQWPADAYQESAPGSSAIVFAPHIKAANDYHDGFSRAGIKAAIVTGTTPKDERVRILAQLESGELPVVINVGVLTEGFDCPRVSTIVIARGVGSAGAFIQMTGRGLRPFPGKREAVLLDLRGVTHLLGSPTDDREYKLDGLGISLGTGVNTTGARLCKVCGLPLGEAVLCAGCGKDNGQETPHAVNAKMSEWRQRYEVAKRQLRPTRASLALASILRRAETDQWKGNAVGYRFRAIFKRWPNESEQLMAREINRLAIDDRDALEKYHDTPADAGAEAAS